MNLTPDPVEHGGGNAGGIILQDRLQHPEVARFCANTRMIADSDLNKTCPETYPLIVEVTTRDGRHLSRRVDHAKGTRQNPRTSEEIRPKYLKLATTVTPAAHAERIGDVA